MVTQPDGTSFALTQHGDGASVWYETVDGYTVTRNEHGRWVYVTRTDTTARALSVDATQLQDTSMVVGRDDPVAAKLPLHIRPAQQAGDNLSTHARSMARSVGGNNPIASITGERHLLVVLGYYDNALSAPSCHSCATTDYRTFQQTVFAADRHSVADYFNTVSHGALTLSPATETQGTANDGIVGWVRLGATMPEGTVTSTSAYKSNRIAADAIGAAKAYVDFTTYDTNNDGRVTSDELALLVVVAGYESSYGLNAAGASLSSDSSSPRIWGQSRSFASSITGIDAPTQTANGKTVMIDTRSNGMTYSIVGELHGSHAATMGIMAHELGHSLFDLPDLYDISGASNGVGVWSLMSYGSWGKALGDTYAGETPVMLDAWSRLALGWVDPTVPNSGDTVTVPTAASADDTVLLLPTERSYEYFLVENRQNSGYDAGLWYFLYTSNFGGIAVWHIDDSIGSAGLNNDNSGSSHRRVDLVAAAGDGSIDERTSYGTATNLYYEGNKTGVSDATSPNTHLYGGLVSGVTITDVSYSAPSMTLRALYSADADVGAVLNGITQLSRSAVNQSASSAAPGGGGAWDALLVLPFAWAARRRLR